MKKGQKGKQSDKRPQVKLEDMRINDRWKNFALNVLSPDTKEPQYQDMKMAFMAGAYSCFCIVELVPHCENDIEAITALKNEIHELLEDFRPAKQG